MIPLPNAPEPSSLDNLAGAEILTRVAIARVYLVLTVGAVVGRKAGALIAPVGETVTRGTILARLSVTQVTFGQHLYHK